MLARQLLASHRPDLAERDRPQFPANAIRLAPEDFLRHRLLLAAVDQREEPLRVEEAAHRLLDRLAGALAGGGRGRRGVVDEERDARPYVERASQFLLAHFSEPLALADIARAAYTSPFYLCRLFRAETGTTVHRRLTELRLGAALDLLASPGADLAAVAHQVGYSTHSHFTAAFRRHLGCTPSAARRALRSRTARRALLATLEGTSATK